mmetsp:Transcript_40909/g.94244  ORF Transcript_40909/g.94244 Transcript_40909/m.94244 type:complete len:448 (-) Transcript_40909:1918-3261(-)
MADRRKVIDTAQYTFVGLRISSFLTVADLLAYMRAMKPELMNGQTISTNIPLGGTLNAMGFATLGLMQRVAFIRAPADKLLKLPVVVILGRLPVDQLLVMGQLHEKDRRRTQLEVAWVKAAAEADRLGLVDVVTKGWTVARDTIESVTHQAHETIETVRTRYTGGRTFLLALVHALLELVLRVWLHLRHLELREAASLTYHGLGDIAVEYGSDLPLVRYLEGPARSARSAVVNTLRHWGHLQWEEWGDPSTAQGRSVETRQHQQRSTLQRFNAQEGMSSLSHYRERPGQQLPERARKRVQKMMHYQVSLRPFTATIQPSQSHDDLGGGSDDDEFGDCKTPGGGAGGSARERSGTPVMCTPQSFPPSPNFRAHVMARSMNLTDGRLQLHSLQAVIPQVNAMERWSNTPVSPTKPTLVESRPPPPRTLRTCAHTCTQYTHVHTHTRIRP